ncbi:hypothetical protein N7512_003237 [Penicillium capsulatum]|nr:hypothetical protein N7512_003237 [Penicillium capsulatum]
MARPFNPVGGRGQRGGATGAPGPDGRGRGRGARGQRFHSTRARGIGGRGRGAGAASSGLSNSMTPATETPAQNNASPFAQLYEPKTTTSAGFGGRSSVTESSVQSTGGRAGFGKNSLAPSLDSAHRSQGQPQRQPNGKRNIPKEQAPDMAHFQKSYDELKINRGGERAKAIKNGQMADPNQPTSLKKAITPVGTCQDMCPQFESYERIVQNMVDKCEKYLDPATHTLQYLPAKMIKRFRRSAAGYDEQLPSDIRTPHALLHTTNYLIRHIIGRQPLPIIHKFVWDRTRSVRNDFSVQQVTQESDVKLAVTCLERIARFHIVSLHLLSSPTNAEQFDPHQEREQLNNTMLSLMYYYDDNRERISFPNEVEFRAYYIIFSIQDQRPDLESRVQKWPAFLLEAPPVQIALDLYAAAGNTWSYQRTIDTHKPNVIAQGFYARFFNIINSPSVSYLMGCVAEIYFNYVRQTAIRAIWKAYCRVPLSQQNKNEEWTVTELTRELHFDSEDDTIEFCKSQDLQLVENAHGQLYLSWGNRPVDSIDWNPSSAHSYSHTYVESKRAGRTLVAIILGMTVREAARMGMIDSSALEHIQTSPVGEESDEDALFVSDKYNQTPAPLVATKSDETPLDDTMSDVSMTNDHGLFAKPQQQPSGPPAIPGISAAPTASMGHGIFGGPQKGSPSPVPEAPQPEGQKPEAFNKWKPKDSSSKQPAPTFGEPKPVSNEPAKPILGFTNPFLGLNKPPAFIQPTPMLEKPTEPVQPVQPVPTAPTADQPAKPTLGFASPFLDSNKPPASEELMPTLAKSTSALNEPSLANKQEVEGQFSVSQLDTSVSETEQFDRPESPSSVESVKESVKPSGHPTDDETEEDETEEEKNAAWERLLKSTAEKHEREKSRKRTRDEPSEAESTQEPTSKASKKKYDPEEARRAYRQFYESLPTLPILEQVRANRPPPPPTEAEIAKQKDELEEARRKRRRQDDEMQMMLNECHIKLHELTKGPSLVELLLQSDMWKREQAELGHRASYGPSASARSASSGYPSSWRQRTASASYEHLRRYGQSSPPPPKPRRWS